MNVLERRGRWGLAVPVTLVAAVLPLAWTAEPAEGPAPPAGPAPAAADVLPEWVGSGKCSGRGCHGAVAPEGTLGSEYNTWKTFDRHARAYTVLLDERSQRIEKNLRGLPDLEAAHAETDALCLKCHDQPGPPPGDRSPLETTTGVGCESCHGNATGWLADHSRPEWRRKDPAQKQAQGLVLLDTAAARVRVCVTCHVGDADREVNHDLIAAGHPRLNFELGAFLADMPRHWDAAAVAAKHKDGPASEAETWAVGQVATARAALDLLAARASRPEAPWPEFTEYGCFACHHDLRDRGMTFWRRELDLRPGALPWGTWAFALLDALATQAGGADGLPKDLDDLARAMGAPDPDRQQVAQHASRIARALDAWLQQLQEKRFTPEQLQEMVVAIRGDPQTLQRQTAHWDAAAQLDLVLAALAQDRGDDPALREVRDALRALLDFPTAPDGTGQDSPGLKFDPAQVRDAVDKVIQALPAP